MELTVDNLKVGARIRLGYYIYPNSPETLRPLFWLKASPDGDFITENVVDYLLFDGKERSSDNRNHSYYGNPNFELSNILQFLNAGENFWYEKTHAADGAPSRENTYSSSAAYDQRPGFLSGFAEYEIASLDGRVELPHISNIFGDAAFPLFKRKGIRPRPMEGLCSAKLTSYGFGLTSYVDFWTQDVFNDWGCEMVRTVGRDGYQGRKNPCEAGGVRPVCRLKGGTRLMVDENGCFCLEPFEVEAPAVQTFSVEDLYQYLGLRLS